MALGGESAAFFTQNAVTGNTSAAKFIPEIWSDEVVAAYKINLKMGGLVKRLPMKGKKGDRINIPKPFRGAANAKGEGVAVTIQANVESEVIILIDQHFEYSKLIEDITEVQALSSMRRFYTDDAGYALANQIDNALFNAATAFGTPGNEGTLDLSPAFLGAEWADGDNSYYNNGGVPAAYAVDTVEDTDLFTDAFFRAMIKKMDDANVPMDGRVFVIPPTLRSTIMGIERYVSSDFRDAKTVQSGLIGTVFGIDIYVSSNCPIVETAAANTATTSTLDMRAAILMHKDALVLAEQMGVRSQTQYKQEYLATLYTADTLYGIQAYRPEAGFVCVVPDA